VARRVAAGSVIIDAMTRRRLDELGDLLELPYCAVLSTHREDGSDLLSPVWHEYLDGGFNVCVPVGDVKLRHLARDPRASIVVFDHAAPGRGFEVRGIVRLLEDTGRAISRRITLRYMDEERAGPYLEKVPPMVVVRLEGIERGWDFREEA